jgi:Flp pilus assembly protein TadB
MAVSRDLIIVALAVLLVTGALLLIVGALLAARAKKRSFESRLGRTMIAQAGHAGTGPTGQIERVRAAETGAFMEFLLVVFAGTRTLPRWLTRALKFKWFVSGIVPAAIAYFVCWFFGELAIWASSAITILTYIVTLRGVFALMKERATSAFLAAFPESLGIFVRMIRAGIPIPDAMRTVGLEAPEPVAEIFRIMSDRLAIGEPIGEIFASMAQRIDVSEFRFFVVAINIQRETGGNLASTLEILGDTIRKRRTARSRAIAATSEVRVSIVVLAAVPFVVMLVLQLMNPTYLTVMFTTTQGRWLLFVAMFLLTAGIIVMRVITRRTLKTST